MIKTCTASSYLARHGKCAALQTRTHAEKRKKTSTGHRDCGTQLCGNRCSLYVITHITGFRLDHRWNRTTMGDNAVTGLVMITVLIQIIAMASVKFFLRFREDRRLGLINKTMECLLRIKTEGTGPVLHDSSKGSGSLVVQMPNHGKCQPSSFNMLDCHAYNC